MTSFAHKFSGIEQQSVYGIRAMVGASYYYYVLAVNRNKEAMLKKLLTSPLKNMDFSQFGKILLSGKGTKPDERAIQMLQKKYAINITFI